MQRNTQADNQTFMVGYSQKGTIHDVTREKGTEQRSDFCPETYASLRAEELLLATAAIASLPFDTG